LNHARRLILVAAVRLIHRAHAFVGLHLRLDGEVVHAVGLAIAVRQSLAEHVDGFEFAAARVIVPYIIDRPKVIFADHRPNALDRRDRRSHAGFTVESVRAPATSGIAELASRLPFRRVGLPVAGRDVLIRPGHLYAAIAGDTGLLTRRGRHHRIRPQ